MHSLQILTFFIFLSVSSGIFKWRFIFAKVMVSDVAGILCHFRGKQSGLIDEILQLII